MLLHDCPTLDQVAIELLPATADDLTPFLLGTCSICGLDHCEADDPSIADEIEADDPRHPGEFIDDEADEAMDVEASFGSMTW